MYLTDINVDAFGTLSACRFDDLSRGLNVIHGPNGSGKTTLLHFLRGVWGGFNPARQQRLLPPLAAGQPGGSIGIASREHLYRLTRQALANQTDRVAVSVRRGAVDDGNTVRAMIDALPTELMRVLYAVTATENHAFDRLLKLATADGISFASVRRPSKKYDERIAEVVRRRHALLGGVDQPGETARLRDACQQSRRTLADLQSEANRLRDELANRYRDVETEIARLADQIEWLDLEVQARETDITEARPQVTYTKHERKVVYVDCETRDELSEQIARIDARIAHARTVLEDLAQNRMALSVQSAQLAGVNLHDTRAVIAQQRTALDGLERQLLSLQAAADTLPVGGERACRCVEFETLMRHSLKQMQEHVYRLCQSIGRQEQGQHHWQVSSERSRIDHCEQEMLQHLQSLQHERDELLARQTQPARAALRHPTVHEAERCGCHEHEHFAATRESRVRVEFRDAPAEPVYMEDGRLPGWRTQRHSLRDELQQTRRAWRDAVNIRNRWNDERNRLIDLERRIAAQHIEVDSREQQLTKCLEEGQARVALEASLRKMQESAFEYDAAL
ncbi:MAG: AAA family ATPase [Planctomycetaceae bacterium]